MNSEDIRPALVILQGSGAMRVAQMGADLTTCPSCGAVVSKTVLATLEDDREICVLAEAACAFDLDEERRRLVGVHRCREKQPDADVNAVVNVQDAPIEV